MGEITLRWVESKLMVASDSKGHSVVIGHSPAPDFEMVGIMPADLLLMAVASCSTWDIVEILAKQREPLVTLNVICSGEQLPAPPSTFIHIHLHYIAHGALNPQKLEKAIRLSEDKYCPVIRSLRPGVPITSDFEIIP